MIRPLHEDLDLALRSPRVVPDVRLQKAKALETGKWRFVVTCGALSRTIDEDELVDFHQADDRRAESMIANIAAELRAAYQHPYAAIARGLPL